MHQPDVSPTQPAQDEPATLKITTYGGGKTVQHWQLHYGDLFLADTSVLAHVERWRQLVAAAPSVSTDAEKVRAQALHEAILAVHNSRFYKGGLDCNYNGVRNAERVLREQLGAQLNYPAHTCESADTGHTPKKERTMRDILAALLRSRGYTHDDEADPYDMHWHHDALGVRPILACVAQEMNDDLGRPTRGWDTYEVSVAR